MISHTGLDEHTSLEEREAFIRSVTVHSAPQQVFLATCNRVELFTGDGDTEHDTVHHLFRTAAGLNSHLVGENHILCQIRRSYNTAIEEETITPGLHRLFQAALKVGKRVRAETSLSRGAVSHSLAAVSLLKSTFSDLSDKKLLIVGATKITEHILGFLKKDRPTSLCIANRTRSRAESAAETFGGRIIDWDDLDAGFESADIIISAVSVDEPVVTVSKIKHINRPLFMIDLSVPRSIEPAIGKFANVRLVNISELEAKIDQNLAERAGSIADAEHIIHEEAADFFNRQSFRNGTAV